MSYMTLRIRYIHFGMWEIFLGGSFKTSHLPHSLPFVFFFSQVPHLKAVTHSHLYLGWHGTQTWQDVIQAPDQAH